MNQFITSFEMEMGGGRGKGVLLPMKRKEIDRIWCYTLDFIVNSILGCFNMLNIFSFVKY